MKVAYNGMIQIGEIWDVHISSPNNLLMAMQRIDINNQNILIGYENKLKQLKVYLVDKFNKEEYGFAENILFEDYSNQHECNFAERHRKQIYMMINGYSPNQKLKQINYRKLLRLEFLLEYDGFDLMHQWTIYFRHFSLSALPSK